jgi:hypothetical protein
MDGYLTKPLRAAELDAVLMAYVELRRAMLAGPVKVLPG